MKVWILLELLLMTLHVSEPYKRTDFTLELKMRSLVRVEMAVDFHTGRRIAKACRAFLIRAEMSSSVPPVWLIMLPRYKFLDIFCCHSFNHYGALLSVICSQHFCFLFANLEPNPLRDLFQGIYLLLHITQAV